MSLGYIFTYQYPEYISPEYCDPLKASKVSSILGSGYASLRVTLFTLH